MNGLKMARLFLVLGFAITVSSQPLETVATSGGATLTTQLLNWAQFGLEAIVEYAKQFFGCNTSEHIFTILFLTKLENVIACNRHICKLYKWYIFFFNCI